MLALALDGSQNDQRAGPFEELYILQDKNSS